MALVTGITLPNNGDRIKAENYNDPINKLLAQVNGNLDESNIASISGTKVTTGTLPYNALNTAAQRTIGGGWNDLGYTFSSVTYNGNRSYTAVVSGQDVTGYVNAGDRVRTTRSVAAPTQCTSLNGTTQYYSKSSPAGMTFTDDFAVGGWVKINSIGTNQVIASRYNGTSGWVFYIEATGQVVLMGINSGSANTSRVLSYDSIPVGKWVYVAAQLDMSTFTATSTTSYTMINGVDVPAYVNRSGTNPTALIQAGNLEVGSWNGGLLPFGGKLAQVAVFNAKVTQATMRGYMSQTLAGNEASLISAYSFNNTINDLNTTNANNLTANGSAVATNADSPFGNQASGLISSTLDYGIITAATFSTDSTLTIQVPEGCTIPTSGGVSAVSYSGIKAPYGFPADKAKWNLVWFRNFRITQVVANSNWVNLPGGSCSVPVGAWRLFATGKYIVTDATSGGYLDIDSRLSTNAGTYVALPREMASVFGPQTTTTESSFQGVVGESELTVSAPTSLYLWQRSTRTTFNSRTIYHDGTYLSIENAYL